MVSKNIYVLPFNEELNLSPEPAPFHYECEELVSAVDFAMPEGTPIRSALDGRVIEIIDGYEKGGPNKSFLNKCNLVIIEHLNEEYSFYVHLRKGVMVKKGDKVKQGEVIGYSGLSGYHTYPHLHFDVRTKNRTIPIRFRIGKEIKVLKSPNF